MMSKNHRKKHDGLDLIAFDGGVVAGIVEVCAAGSRERLGKL